MIDPSAALRTPVRAGPNGADRVLGDIERRLKEIFLDFAEIGPLFSIAARRIDKNRIQKSEFRRQYTECIMEKSEIRKIR